MTKEIENPAVYAPEDKFRMNAAEHLDAMLSHCPRMLGLCEELLDGKDGALILSSAARLISAGADAALAQLRVTMGETRHRSISEKACSETLPGLNANFRTALAKEKEERNEGALEELIRRIDRIAEAKRINEARERGIALDDEDIALDDEDAE
jgi:hypothetical protein